MVEKAVASWKNEKWFVSAWNYEPEVAAENCFPQRVVIHDITLRDGEQQAGVVFTTDDKLRIAEKLAEAGVDRIEAGMPAVSPADEKAIREIVRRRFGCKVFGFARCLVEDIYRVADCGVDGVVVEIPSSEHIIEKAYLWPPERAIERAIQATRAAKEAGLYTVFFTIDASRANLAWLTNLLRQVATEGHMDAMALVDTMGVCSPQAIRFFVRHMQAEFPGIPLEAHFHNDLGLALANTIEALRLGVPVAHVSVCGIGERAGGAALEELVVALETLYGVKTGVKMEKLYELCQLTVGLAGHRLPTNKPVVGERLFHIESGIPATWWLRCREAAPTEVFPFHWKLMGQPEPCIVLGKGSGEDSVKAWLAEIGVEVPESAVPELLAKVKASSLEKKGLLSQDEFCELAKVIRELHPQEPGTVRGSSRNV
ncbi:MAG: pyruvate carboxyltransferase [Bacillota bacterium]